MAINNLEFRSQLTDGLDKKLHKSAFHTASPYQLLLHNQRYYLMARNEYWKDVVFYRLDAQTRRSQAG